MLLSSRVAYGRFQCPHSVIRIHIIMKLLTAENNCQHFFFDLGIISLSCRERLRGISDRELILK